MAENAPGVPTASAAATPADSAASATANEAPRAVEGRAGHGPGFWGLALGSVGVVFGDIGTSPLYACLLYTSDAADE